MIGETISHYSILEELGRGGMGVVYKARDIRLDRIVALKFLSPHLSASEEDKERFRVEARAASALNHPNILTVFDIDEHDGGLFIAMEYVEGETVKSIVKRQKTDLERAVTLAIQMVEGIQSAHAKGIVHRDIKSENVMVTADGRVKIMDFGVAQFAPDGENLTQAGRIVGTIQYMSPEQIEGKPVDHRSDIFSLGVVLFELLARRLPFEGEYDVAVLYSILNQDPPSLDELDPFIPHEISELVGRCLRKSRDERYNDCGELLEDLRSSSGSRVVDIPALVVPQPGPPEGEVFLGREAQIETLRRQMDRAAGGKGATVFIKGESGIGKTRLAAMAAGEAPARGLSVLWGRCLFQEGGLPYHPFVAALQGILQNSGIQVIEALARRGERRGMMLGGRLSYVKAFLNLSTESAALLNREQLWDAVLVLFKIIAADRPLLLIIDDLQWADPATLGLCAFIARSISDIPMLQVGIYRQVHPVERDVDSTPLEEIVRQLRIEDVAEHIELERWRREETDMIVRELLGKNDVDRKVLNRIHSSTEGNPLFVLELVKLMKEQRLIRYEQHAWRLQEDVDILLVSQKVRDVILQRLNRLTREDRDILEVASCDGMIFQSDTIAACVSIERIPLLKRLQVLEADHRVIRRERTGYRFDHPVIRQVLYESILPELREEYHRTIAARLMEHHADDREFATRIAHHLGASGQEEESLKYLLLAADRAREVHAAEEAMQYYRRAGDIAGRRPVADDGIRLIIEEGLGDTSFALGKAGEAFQHYASQLEIARRTVRTEGDTGKHPASGAIKEIEALRKSADCLRITGSMPEAVTVCRDALELAVQQGSREEKINCLNTLAIIHLARGEYDQAESISQEALTLSTDAADARNQSISLRNLGSAYVHRGNYLLAVDRLEDALVLQRSIGDTRGLATSLNYLGLSYHRLGRYEQALVSHMESLKIKKSIADFHTIPGSLNGIGDLYRDMFDPEKAIEYHEESLLLAREYHNKGAECDNLRDLGADYLLLGDLETSVRYLTEVLDLSRASGYAWYETRSCISLGEAWLRLGKVEQAKQYSDLALRSASGLDAKELIVEALWCKAAVMHQSASPDDGVRLMQQAIDLAESIGQQSFLWQLYSDLGRQYGEMHRPDDMRRCLEKAKEIVRTVLGHFHDRDLLSQFRQSAKVQEVLNAD